MKTPIRLLIAAAAVFVIATAGGQAYAYFTVSASGAGSGTVHTTLQVLVDTGNLAGAGKSLLPGVERTLTATVTNDNPMAATLEAVTVGTILSSSVDCAPSYLTVLPPIPLPSAPIAAHGATTVPVTVTLSAGAPNSCQTVTFTIPLTVEVRS